jgi:hypothetical protein
MRTLAAVVLFAGLACRPSPAPTRFLNFDAASGPEALRTGWSSFESAPEGDTYVWADAREARLEVRSGADSDQVIRFRCWPFWFEGAPAQTALLRLNGTAVETVRLAPDRRAYTVYVPRELWREGSNDLTFAFAYAERPSDHAAGQDTRTLAVAFDWLEIVPPPRPR